MRNSENKGSNLVQEFYNCLKNVHFLLPLWNQSLVERYKKKELFCMGI